MTRKQLDHYIAVEIKKMDNGYSKRFKHIEKQLMEQAGLTSMFQNPRKYSEILKLAESLAK